MKYAWIERHKNRWPVTLQCEVLNISTSGYFERQRRKESGQPPTLGKRISDEALLVHIKAVYGCMGGQNTSCLEFRAVLIQCRGFFEL